MVLIFVRRVPVNITKLATPALVAQRVALGKDKRLLVLQIRIVSVLKTIVLVPMGLQPRAKHVLPMMLIFVRRVPVNITKLATHALVALRVHRADTKQEHHVMAVVVLTHKSVRHAPVADWANTKKGSRVLVVPLTIHKVVLRV